MEKEHFEMPPVERLGTYGDRNVRGWRHTNERGHSKWRIRTWLDDGNPFNEYWVMSKRFYEFIPRNDDEAETGILITEMDEGEKKAVLAKVEEWEGQMPKSPCT